MKEHPSSLRFALFALFVFAPTLFAGASFAGEPTPTLKIQRQVWDLEEDVVFVSGVDGQDLTPADIEECGIEIVGPDGVRQRKPTVWPRSTYHDPALGWRAERRLAASETVAGTYSVRASCRGRSVEGSFEVREIEVLRDIDFRVEFEPTCRGEARDETVSIVLENRSSFPVFAALQYGIKRNSVGVELHHRETGVVKICPVPPRILGLMHVVPGDVMLEHLEWDQLHRIDVDRLAPGESVGRSFCVSDLVNVPCSDTTWPPGYVRIKSSTEIQVGPRDGPWAEMGPFRLYTYAERVVPQELELPAGYGPRH